MSTQLQMESLQSSLDTLTSLTNSITKSTAQINNSTSFISTMVQPAKEARKNLTVISTNLTATVFLLKDAQWKFTAVRDNHHHVMKLSDSLDLPNSSTRSISTEDVSNVIRAVEVLGEALRFFSSRRNMKSASEAIEDLGEMLDKAVGGLVRYAKMHLEVKPAVRMKYEEERKLGQSEELFGYNTPRNRNGSSGSGSGRPDPPNDGSRPDSPFSETSRGR